MAMNFGEGCLVNTRLIGAAIAGACLAAAAPAWAVSGETAATATNASVSDKYRPVVIDKRGMQLRKSSRPLTLNAPSSPDVFGTVALNAGVTFYDARFRRVASTDSKDPLVLGLAQPAMGLDPVAKLQMVQQEVNQRV